MALLRQRLIRLNPCLKFAGLSLLGGALTCTSGFAQIPSQSKSSPLNYLARFHGLGYSDGYHSCPSNQCEPNQSRLTAPSFSSFYGEPSAPPPGRFQRPAPSYATHQSFGAAVEPYASTNSSYAPSQHSHPAFSPYSIPASSLHAYPDYSSAIPSQSILLDDRELHTSPSSTVYPTPTEPYPTNREPRRPTPTEMLPPPKPIPSPNQSRRAIPGSTRLYQANFPSSTNGR